MPLLMLPRKILISVSVAIAVAMALTPVSSFAAEVQLILGGQSYSSLNGCCISEPAREGYGMMIQIQPDKYDAYEVFGYTDRKWSEIQLMKPFILRGGDDGLDPSSSPSMKIRRLSNWKIILSPGAGFFIHNSRTTNYDLPAVVSGMTVGFYLRSEHAVTDWFSMTIGVRAAGSYATDDQGFVAALLTGALVRF